MTRAARPWPMVLCLAAALLAAAPAMAATLSGLYDGLLLDVQGDRVEGAYTSTRRGNGTDDAPQFSCAFLLRGHIRDGKAAIQTWTPGDSEVVPGQLTLAQGSATLRLQQDQDGCGMAVGGMARSDFDLSFFQPGADWIGVALVHARRAVLHAAPAADTRHVPYLVAFDAVAVLARQPGWVQVRYLGGNKPVTGWLQAADLVAEHWPTTTRAP